MNKQHVLVRFSLCFFALFSILPLSAQLEVSVNQSDAIYEVGETAFFQAKATYSSPATYEIIYDEQSPVIESGTINLVAGQNFSISYTNVEAEDTTVQYGFQVVGVNANPDNEDALGSIVVVDNVLSTNDFDAASISTYPNPVVSNWNVQAQDAITSIKMYNALGQQVLNVAPDARLFSQDLSSLAAGVYLTTISTEQGSKTIKVIKK